MKVVELNRNPTMTDALAAVDALRKAIESGEVISFVAAGVSPDDACVGFAGSSKPVSKLRMIGALYNALRAVDEGSFA